MMNDTDDAEKIISRLNTLKIENPNDYKTVQQHIILDFLTITYQTAQTPAYIKFLIDKCQIDEKKVVKGSLNSVAKDLRNFINSPITNRQLEEFINPATNKPYSDSAIRKAVELANAR